MNLEITEQLDPVFETMGLLYVSYQPESYLQKSIGELDTFGLNGEAFYNKHLKFMEKYTTTFSRHRIVNKQAEFFFNDEDGVFFNLLHELLSQNPEWFTSLASITEKTLRDTILIAVKEMETMQNHSFGESALVSFQSLDEIIGFLNESPLKEAVKWKLMTLLQHPHRHLITLTEAVSTNLPAYEKACQAVEKPLSRLLATYTQAFGRQQDEHYIKLVRQLSDKQVIVHPALITPLALIMLSTRCYYGLLIHLMPNASKNQEDSRELMLLRMKALADNSKLQILASLKVNPKYNLEIADQLGLTAATISHHMNVLLACKMVRVEKNNGRVYYHLDSENLQELISDLQQFLL
ncbi:ArsR/SmtB family transcription factor [Paenibacillus camerounensis]|uniref:ArsR/SmtB family transcription factor n=1 Tax=Paenibacillus camerounensis TaxID=1243663 RepID=UPI0005A6CA45|nr:metalloregulator ArsR/SmtB family transcription factor [Paenibacillus camerounensis]